MKNILKYTGICLGLFACATAFADSYKFNCPNPAKLVLDSSGVIIYTPYDPSSGMPANLAGGGNLGVSNAGWAGLVFNNIEFTSLDVNNSHFEQLASSGTLTCSYKVNGKNKAGNNVSADVYMQPGNPNYANLYNYSLSNGSSFSNDINVQVVAVSK